MTKTMEKGLNSNALKWIAITAMLIDHIAWGFVPTYSVLGQVMHVIGRITAPTMCYFIVEGYYHTHDVKKYALRLGIFALAAELPYYYFEAGNLQFRVGTGRFDVIYTLLCSLLAVWAWDKIRNRPLKVLVIFGLCLLATLGDWMFFDVLFSLVFAAYRGSFKKQALWFSIVAVLMVAMMTVPGSIGGGAPDYSQLFQLGVLLALPLLALYNGERGGGKNAKWVFYVFYPLHLLILGLLKLAVG